jgi:hydroxymethylbilane synthase
MNIPTKKTLKLLTRDSDLAVTQSTEVKKSIEGRFPDLTVELHSTKAIGDTYRDVWEEFIKDRVDTFTINKRKWIFELEESIANGMYDIAVHSGKDLPYNIKEGTSLIPVLKREDPYDVLITEKGVSFYELSAGAVIGTGSLRRKAQILFNRKDLVLKNLKGNVPTRLRKVYQEKLFDGIVIAAAGLKRLKVMDPSMYRFVYTFTDREMVPAVNQGILVAQYKTGNKEVESILSALCDEETFAMWNAERRCVEMLQASCETALGVHAVVTDEKKLKIVARGVSTDGEKNIEKIVIGDLKEAQELGEALASALIAGGLKEILDWLK